MTVELGKLTKCGNSFAENKPHVVLLESPIKLMIIL